MSTFNKTKETSNLNTDIMDIMSQPTQVSCLTQYKNLKLANEDSIVLKHKLNLQKSR